MRIIIVNDVIQPIKGNPSWIHHATLKRGLKEYILFRNKITNEIFIEEVEDHVVNVKLKKIKDDEEWKDLVSFCNAAGLLQVVDNKRGTKIATKQVP